MKYGIRLGVLSAALITLSLQANAAPLEFQSVVRRLPSDANVLLLFDVEKILASPLAQKQGWREKSENAFAAGLTYLPPQANHFAMASQIDLEVNQPHWQAAVIDLKYEASMPKLAAMHNGSVDEIEGRSAAVLPPDTYVIQFMKTLVAVMSPADRQKVGRYVRQVYASSRQPLSDYLLTAESYANQGVPIIMAIDLQHVMSPQVIRDRLGNFAALKGRNVDLDQLSKVLATIQGLTLGITIGDDIKGAFIVDFGQDISMITDFAQPLLLEALANHGAMIDEFKTWTPSVKGKRLKLSGPLFASGMQRIMSLVDTPPAMQAQQTAAASDGQGADGQGAEQRLVALASQQHFKAVSSLLDDLLQSERSSRSVGQAGLWFEKYARRIEALPILNVDKDLVNFSASVADQLRQAHGAVAGAQQEAAVRKADAPNVQSYNVAARGGMAMNRWGGMYGGYQERARYAPWRSLRLKGQQQARISTEERAKGGSQANAILESVGEATAEIRRQMTDRYGVEF